MSVSINTPIALYDEMAELWALPEALMGGTRAMRQAGTIYLPREGAYQENAAGVATSTWVGESNQAYQRRLNRTVLYNAYRKAIHGLRGKVFSKPITWEGPARFNPWLDDIDLQGHDLTAFAFDVFGAALNYGISYIMVDSTRLPEGATEADARRAGARPYLIHVPAKRLIGWRFDDDGLEQVRIREYDTVPEGDYDINSVIRVRVLYRDHWELHEAKLAKDAGPLNSNRLLAKQTTTTVDQGGSFDLVDEGPNALGEIALVPVYTGRVGEFQAEPPLMDLAYKNLEHWQSSSDQRHILHVARVPLLFAKGVSGDDTLEIGANQLISSTSPDAELKYVEHSGTSIDAGREDLERIELQMRALSLEPMLPKSGDITATRSAIDKAEADSSLQAWALNLQDALDMALYWMDRYAGRDEGAKTKVNSNFGLSLESDEDVKSLLQLWLSDGLSLETLWSELKRRGKLDEDFDADKEVGKINTQEPRLPMRKPTTSSAA